jgi:hypothetical protein
MLKGILWQTQVFAVYINTKCLKGLKGIMYHDCLPSTITLTIFSLHPNPTPNSPPSYLYNEAQIK